MEPFLLLNNVSALLEKYFKNASISFGTHLYLDGSGVNNLLISSHPTTDKPSVVSPKSAVQLMFDHKQAGRPLPDGLVLVGKKIVSYIRHKLDIISKKY